MDKITEIKNWIVNCDSSNPAHQKALHRAVLIVYRNQTQTERANQATLRENGKGFNKHDARFGSWVAERALEVQLGTSKYQSLSPKMYAALIRMLPKYAKQIAAGART